MAAAAAREERAADRRRERFLRRWRLGDVTSMKRLPDCGHAMRAGAAAVPVRLADRVAHYGNLVACASVWACPVCGPKIRQHRADEIDAALQVATAAGMGVGFLTLTCRHSSTDRLDDLRRAQERAWKRFSQSKPWRRLSREQGLGFIQQREVTHGTENGWHPHRHLALVLDEVQTDDQLEAIRAALWPAWSTALAAEGLDALEAWGLDLRAGAEALADYMLKVRGSDDDLAMEMMRGDLKRGRNGRRTPEQILTDWLEDGRPADLALWHEYEQATLGWRMTTWSTGLRKKLRQPEEEATDEQLAELEVGGETVVVLSPAAWRRIRHASPGGRALLTAVEKGRWRQYLLRIVGPSGWEPGPVPDG